MSISGPVHENADRVGPSGHPSDPSERGPLTPGGHATPGHAEGTGPKSLAEIEISSLAVSYGEGRVAVRDVSFAVRTGETLAIVGPSGCGKSTILKAVAGLLSPSAGTVSVTAGAEEHPRIGFVFQSDALLPWRTAVQNVELAVRLAGEGRRVARERALGLMADLGLADACDQYPSELSGGMRKRVSLARALAHDPAVLLMDEPLSALDAHTRIQVGNFFLAIQERYGQSCLFVTHDIDEAVAVGDNVLILSRSPGQVVGLRPVPIARPRDYYESRFDPVFKDVQQEIWHMLRGND